MELHCTAVAKLYKNLGLTHIWGISQDGAYGGIDASGVVLWYPQFAISIIPFEAMGNWVGVCLGGFALKYRICGKLPAGWLINQ